MLEYINDVEDCIQELLRTLKVENKIELNLKVVDNLEIYLNRIIQRKICNSPDVVVILGSNKTNSTIKEIKDWIKLRYPDCKVYDLYSSRIHPERILILTS